MVEQEKHREFENLSGYPPCTYQKKDFPLTKLNIFQNPTRFTFAKKKNAIVIKTYKLPSAFFQPDSNRDQPRGLNLAGHVGFDSLPDQLVNKSVASGFCFNILCVGKYNFIVLLSKHNRVSIAENDKNGPKNSVS